MTANAQSLVKPLYTGAAVPAVARRSQLNCTAGCRARRRAGAFGRTDRRSPRRHVELRSARHALSSSSRLPRRRNAASEAGWKEPPSPSQCAERRTITTSTKKRRNEKKKKKKSDVSWGQHLVCNDCLLRAFRQYEVTLEFSLVLFFISFSFLRSSLYVVED